MSETTSTLQALLCTEFGPIDRLTLAELPRPTPGPRQVLIDVKAAALNFPDALIVQGLYQMRPPLPFAPGAEIAGVVAAVGEKVSRLRVGDRVTAFPGFGGFATACLADESLCMPLPEGMGFDVGAALVLTYGTSLHALRTCAALQQGETLVVLGASGGVGLAAIEIGKTMGARVIAAASSAGKLALCAAAGADALIDYSTESLKDRILELTAGNGADVVYDPVGGDYTEAALRATAWRGRYLVVGFAAGEIPRPPLNLALLKERRIIGVFWGEATQRDPKTHLENMAQLREWYAAGRISPRITERIDLAGAKDALQRMAARQTMGKVVVTFAD